MWEKDNVLRSTLFLYPCAFKALEQNWLPAFWKQTEGKLKQFTLQWLICHSMYCIPQTTMWGLCSSEWSTQSPCRRSVRIFTFYVDLLQTHDEQTASDKSPDSRHCWTRILLMICRDFILRPVVVGPHFLLHLSCTVHRLFILAMKDRSSLWENAAAAPGCAVSCRSFWESQRFWCCRRAEWIVSRDIAQWCII